MLQPEPALSNPEMLAGQRILLVEDDSVGLSDTERLLQEAGADVLLASTAYQAVLVATQHALTAAVLDVELGAHTLEQICSHLEQRAIPFVLMDMSGETLSGDWGHAAFVDTSAGAVARLREIAPISEPPEPVNRLHAQRK
jgi:CheY-like chemotaxis protein